MLNTNLVIKEQDRYTNTCVLESYHKAQEPQEVNIAGQYYTKQIVE